MARQRHTTEQIIGKLHEAEVAKGQTVVEVCRSLGVTEQTYYLWRQAYNQVRPHSELGYRPPAQEAIELQTEVHMINRGSGTTFGGRSPKCV